MCIFIVVCDSINSRNSNWNHVGSKIDFTMSWMRLQRQRERDEGRKCECEWVERPTKSSLTAVPTHRERERAKCDGDFALFLLMKFNFLSSFNLSHVFETLKFWRFNCIVSCAIPWWGLASTLQIIISHRFAHFIDVRCLLKKHIWTEHHSQTDTQSNCNIQNCTNILTRNEPRTKANNEPNRTSKIMAKSCFWYNRNVFVKAWQSTRTK